MYIRDVTYGCVNKHNFYPEMSKTSNTQLNLTSQFESRMKGVKVTNEPLP